MGNGCLKVTPTIFKGMSLEEKIDCLFEVAIANQMEIAKLRHWWNLRSVSMFFASMSGGAVMTLILFLLGVKILPGG
jgi:hypothetical protein